jgi:hypothetical protein
MCDYFILFLIVFFILLVGCSLFLKIKSVFSCWLVPCREGMENKEDDEKEDDTYQSYDTNSADNALILAQKNAGNIMTLDQKIKSQGDFSARLDKLEDVVDNQQDQINGLVEQQAQYAEDISASEPVEITGMNEE